MMISKKSTAVIGATGEHYIAAFLSANDIIVALPRAGVPGCDMLITEDKNGRAIKLQVKTGTQATKTTREEGKIYLWSFSYKALERKDKYLWYALVCLNDWPVNDNRPEIFFVPSRVIAKCLRKCNKDGEKWPFFWMKLREANLYRDFKGLRLMTKMI